MPFVRVGMTRLTASFLSPIDHLHIIMKSTIVCARKHVGFNDALSSLSLLHIPLNLLKVPPSFCALHLLLCPHPYCTDGYHAFAILLSIRYISFPAFVVLLSPPPSAVRLVGPHEGRADRRGRRVWEVLAQLMWLPLLHMRSLSSDQARNNGHNCLDKIAMYIEVNI